MQCSRFISPRIETDEGNGETVTYGVFLWWPTAHCRSPWRRSGRARTWPPSFTAPPKYSSMPTFRGWVQSWLMIWYLFQKLFLVILLMYEPNICSILRVEGIFQNAKWRNEGSLFQCNHYVFSSQSRQAASLLLPFKCNSWKSCCSALWIHDRWTIILYPAPLLFARSRVPWNGNPPPSFTPPAALLKHWTWDPLSSLNA